MNKITYLIISWLAFLYGCTVAPIYDPPTTETPIQWKEETPLSNPAPPVSLWWEVFHDPLLNELEVQTISNNYDLYVSLQKVIEARAMAGVQLANLYPQLNFNPAFTDSGYDLNAHLPKRITTLIPPGFRVPNRIFDFEYCLPLNLSYEVDLWGKLRSQYDFALYSAEAQAEAFQSALLTLTAEVANAYFQARALDSQIKYLKETLITYQEEINFTSSRFKRGLVNFTDVTNAEFEYNTAEAALHDAVRLRALQEHMLAVLIGVPPACFTLKYDPLKNPPPEIPPGIPANVLQQRPDIAEAERNLAAENQSIGVANAAFFPSLQLTGVLEYSGLTIHDFLSLHTSLWQVGGNVAQNIFDGGRNLSNLAAAWAQFREASGTYQQQVLTAFQEVEDALNNVANQAKQYNSLEKAVQASNKTTNLTRDRYQKGITFYLDLIYSERNELNAQVQAIQVLGARYTSTIQLIKALGGSWEESLQPFPKEPCR